eukprot:TRINITY_DN7469_c0_g1_i6.p1 TRINITY_DN7469_c0_g1~~TRINITY_DN7469_c0_g1_i6.p1  ORF type:complete len:308 (-),score=74.58 TRINITY_DN7469_c0_g1_i6:35-958(-)
MSELGKSSNMPRLQLGLKLAKPKPVDSYPQAYHSINSSFATGQSRNEVGQHKGTLTQEKERGGKHRIKLITRIPSVPKSHESSVLTDKGAEAKKPANESFSCKELKERETRSHSQFAKICALQLKCGARNAYSQAKKHKFAARRVGHYTCGDDKENVDKSNKIAIKISTNTNIVASKKLLTSTNGTFINNLSTNSVIYSSQLESAKKANFTKSNEPPQSSTERNNSQSMELVLRLERKIRKYKGNNKLNMYSSCFDEIIKADPYFSTLLREIKNEYEFTITELTLSLIHICRCRRYAVCRSRWSPYH